jgi:hypothetical protein
MATRAEVRAAGYYRGHKKKALCNRRFVAPVERRRVQDAFDAAVLNVVYKTLGIDKTVDAATLTAERGGW